MCFQTSERSNTKGLHVVCGTHTYMYKYMHIYVYAYTCGTHIIFDIHTSGVVRYCNK